MSDPNTKLRVVGIGEPPPRRRKGPGLAVILVGLYALTFAAGLILVWNLTRAKRDSSRTQGPGSAAAASPSRASLLAGEGLKPAARSEYLRELSHDCCDCGCDLTLQKCLAGHEKCPRSPDLAQQRRRKID